MFQWNTLPVGRSIKLSSKPYENLVTVDVMCHSITSPKIFRMYVEMQKEKYGDDIENIMFRDKSHTDISILL